MWTDQTPRSVASKLDLYRFLFVVVVVYFPNVDCCILQLVPIFSMLNSLEPEMCNLRDGRIRSSDPPTPLENRKWLFDFLDILARTSLGKQLDPMVPWVLEGGPYGPLRKKYFLVFYVTISGKLKNEQDKFHADV